MIISVRFCLSHDLLNAILSPLMFVYFNENLHYYLKHRHGITCFRREFVHKNSLFHDQGVPLGQTGIVILGEGLRPRVNMTIQWQFNIEAHLDHIIYMLLYGRGVPLDYIALGKSYLPKDHSL